MLHIPTKRGPTTPHLTVDKSSNLFYDTGLTVDKLLTLIQLTIKEGIDHEVNNNKQIPKGRVTRVTDILEGYRAVYVGDLWKKITEASVNNLFIENSYELKKGVLEAFDKAKIKIHVLDIENEKKSKWLCFTMIENKPKKENSVAIVLFFNNKNDN